MAVLLTAFIELTGPRRRRLRVPLDGEAPGRLREFLGAVATHQRWDRASEQRLQAAGVEALVVIEWPGGDPGRQLAVFARPRGRSFEVEFATVVEGDNIEDRLAYLDDLPPVPDEDEVSFRLLRHHTSSVRHQIGMRAGLLLTADTRLRREHGLTWAESHADQEWLAGAWRGRRPAMQQDSATTRSIEGKDGPAITVGLDVGDRYTHIHALGAGARCCASGASAPRRRRWAQR